MRAMELTVGEVARQAGITVRALHHYDEIGLVSPSQRSPAGYRLYGAEAIDRLQEVLFFRELGFALDDIKAIVAAPSYDRAAALGRQRRLVERKAARLFDMMDALDRALEAHRRGVEMTPEEKLEVFGDFDPDEHAAEAEERWGGTAAYQESARRTGSYTKAEWQRLEAEARRIDEGLAALLAEGVPPGDERAMDLAEAHRAHISRWFYDCPPEMHAGLGRMYVEDQRFRESIDRAGEGLAEYLAAAIAANAARA